LIGIQLAATLKNILALLCGYSDGKGGGINQKSVIITKGVSEI
jgi:glycerol-3-phosphate dehydrogenase